MASERRPIRQLKQKIVWEKCPGRVWEAIIDPALFEQVRAVIEANRQAHRTGARAKSPSLLTGMESDPDGRPMSPSHTRKASKRYRYYETRTRPGEAKDQVWRLPAGEIDRLVIAAITDHLRDSSKNDISSCARELSAQIVDKLDLADRLSTMPVPEQRRELIRLKLRVALDETAVAISLGEKDDRQHLTIAATLAKRGSEVRLILQERPTASPDSVLRKLVAQAFAARDYLMRGTKHACIKTYSQRYLARVARISWIAPDMIVAMLDGTQPLHLTSRRLIRANAIPIDWSSQRAMFGFC